MGVNNWRSGSRDAPRAKAYWYRRFPRTGIFVFSAAALLFILVLTETCLRISGLQAGVIYGSDDFRKVKNLALIPDYQTGQDGIMKFHPDICIKSRELLSDPSGINRKALRRMWKTGKMNRVLDLFFNFKSIETAEGEFGKFIKALHDKEPQSRTNLDSAYIQYTKSPVNEEGFRSIPFKQYETKKKKVLLLGDSFTWGHEASPLYNSFADLLSARGIIVFNSGIPGSDPAQYEAIAKKYIPLLKPDFVILNFFMGNDVMYFKREVRPGQPIYYKTNAGNLYSCPGGEYLKSPEEAYQFILRQASVPLAGESTLNRFCARTVLGTKYWLLLEKMGVVSLKTDPLVKEYWDRSAPLTEEKPVSEFHLKEIESVCQANNADYIIGIIPYENEIDIEIEASFPGLFSKTKVNIPPNLTKSDYESSGHFNNEGHRKYADFLEALIRQDSTSAAAPISDTPKK